MCRSASRKPRSPISKRSLPRKKPLRAADRNQGRAGWVLKHGYPPGKTQTLCAKFKRHTSRLGAKYFVSLWEQGGGFLLLENHGSRPENAIPPVVRWDYAYLLFVRRSVGILPGRSFGGASQVLRLAVQNGTSHVKIEKDVHGVEHPGDQNIHKNSCRYSDRFSIVSLMIG